MSPSRYRSLGVVPVLLMVVGCSQPAARQVLRTRDSGIVAIPDNTDRFPTYHRSAALGLIRSHVGRNFEIDREEEYILGPVTTNATASRRRPTFTWFIPWRLGEHESTTNTSTTVNQTEYRIYYRRAGSSDSATDMIAPSYNAPGSSAPGYHSTLGSSGPSSPTSPSTSPPVGERRLPLPD